MAETALAPNPATNSMPPSADSVTPADVTPNPDWDFLDQGNDLVPPDPRFNDEDDEEIAEDEGTEPQKLASSPDAKAEEGEGSTKPAEEPAKPAEPTADVKALQTEAAYYQEFDKALRTDPTQVASAILDGMDARSRAAFLQQYIGETTYPEFKADEYEPQGEMEEALRHRWQDIEAVPQLISDTRQLDQAVRALSEQASIAPQLVPHVTEANVLSNIALSKIEALCELLEIELPDPDPQEILKGLDGGKGTYRDAVRKAISYKEKIEAKKQAGKPRPITPGNGTRRSPTLTKEMNAVDIARAIGTIPQR
jgi:hypothetical protein